MSLQVLVSHELFDEMEQKWAPPDDPVFELVPPLFNTQANAIYVLIGKPPVTSKSFWDVYSKLLQAFRTLPPDSAVTEFLSGHVIRDDCEEVPLLPGLKELRNGDRVVGAHGYHNTGGTPSDDDNGDVIQEDEENFREFADFTPDEDGEDDV
jgi:hypothetical protein